MNTKIFKNTILLQYNCIPVFYLIDFYTFLLDCILLEASKYSYFKLYG